MNERPPLDAAEAAARLGVKRQTLYAYVSRGLLRSRPATNGRGSVFDAAEVDALLRRSRAGRESSQELTIATAVTSIGHGELRFRGHLAAELAGTQPFESVAALLWTGELAWWPCVANPAATAAVAAVAAATPPGARLLDRIRLAIDVAAVTDPLRFELASASVAACGRTMVAVMTEGIEWRGRRGRERGGPSCRGGSRGGAGGGARSRSCFLDGGLTWLWPPACGPGCPTGPPPRPLFGPSM